MSRLKRHIFMAMCISILFVQEQLLMIVPNVQFTTLLIVLYASLFKFRETVAIILIYVFFDNLFMSSFHPLYTTAMIIGWLIIPVAYHTLLNKTTSETKLALFGLSFGFVYGWVFIPFRMFEHGIDIFWPYLLADIPFEIIMAVSNYVTIILLFQPLRRIVSQEFDALLVHRGFSGVKP